MMIKLFIWLEVGHFNGQICGFLWHFAVWLGACAQLRQWCVPPILWASVGAHHCTGCELHPEIIKDLCVFLFFVAGRESILTHTQILDAGRPRWKVLTMSVPSFWGLPREERVGKGTVSSTKLGSQSGSDGRWLFSILNPIPWKNRYLNYGMLYYIIIGLYIYIYNYIYTHIIYIYIYTYTQYTYSIL